MTKKHLTTKLLLIGLIAIHFVQHISAMATNNTEPELSFETEQFIRQVQKEMGMEDWIIRLGEWPGSKNASAYGSGKKNGSICIDGEWLNSLPEREKRQFIGHELIHLKKEHALTWRYFRCKILFMTTIPLCIAAQVFRPVNKVFLPLILTNFFFIYKPLQAWAAKNIELEADLEAARELNNFQGGIAFERHRAQDEASRPKSFMEKSLLFKGLNKLRLVLYYDHPSHEERAANLQKEASIATIHQL